jgi:hypothetical protein
MPTFTVQEGYDKQAEIKIKDGEFLIGRDPGCDFVLVGRGAIGNPFVFSRFNKFYETGEETAEPSVAEIKEGIFPLRRAGLVVANMIAPILLRLFAAGLADLIAPGGSLILAGMLTDQVDEMLSKLDEYGLKVSARRQISDWVALCVKR